MKKGGKPFLTTVIWSSRRVKYRDVFHKSCYPDQIKKATSVLRWFFFEITLLCHCCVLSSGIYCLQFEAGKGAIKSFEDDWKDVLPGLSGKMV